MKWIEYYDIIMLILVCFTEYIFFSLSFHLFFCRTHTQQAYKLHIYDMLWHCIDIIDILLFTLLPRTLTSHHTAHTFYSSLLVLSLPKTPTSRNTNTNKIKKIQVARELGWEWVKLYFTLIIIISVSVSPRQVVVMRWQVVYSKK